MGKCSFKTKDNKIKQATTVENTSKNNKGYFTSLSALNTAFPSPKSWSKMYTIYLLNYYLYNVIGGIWTASTVEAPSIEVDLIEYTKSGGSSKTLKQVDDELTKKGIIPLIIPYAGALPNIDTVNNVLDLQNCIIIYGGAYYEMSKNFNNPKKPNSVKGSLTSAKIVFDYNSKEFFPVDFSH